MKEWYEIYEVKTNGRVHKVDEDARLGYMQVVLGTLATYPNSNVAYYYIKDNKRHMINFARIKK